MSPELEEEFKKLRRLHPVETPLPVTLQWSETLPSNVRPHAVLQRYGRIANIIARSWKTPKSFDVYMESLLVVTRGNRRGFPPDVLSELIELYRYHKLLRQHPSWKTLGGIAE